MAGTHILSFPQEAKTKCVALLESIECKNERMKNCQNGTFEPVHEIQNFFWPKAFFWSIMKMAIRIFFRNMSQGLPNPGFMQEKVKKGDFLKEALVGIEN